MFTRKLVLFLMVVVTGATLSACTWTFEKNEDGSWQVTGEIGQEETQEAIDDSLDDPLISNVQVDFKDGYIDVTADRLEPDTNVVEPLTFKLYVSVVDGHLGAEMADVTLAGEPFSPAYVDVWNERMANNLERNARRRPNSTLEEAYVTEDSLTLSWRVETAESRENQND
ncbi:MAG: hypothetical protein GYB65_12520 [Chloroflexi bacterium]|nr:hypothetical protein [Chloroflexota bacterium]